MPVCGAALRRSSTLPDARLEWIEDSYTFSPEDRPDRLAELIASFAQGTEIDPAGRGVTGKTAG